MNSCAGQIIHVNQQNTNAMEFQTVPILMMNLDVSIRNMIVHILSKKKVIDYVPHPYQ